MDLTLLPTTQWEPEPTMRTGLTEPDCRSWTSNRFEPHCLSFRGICPKPQKTALAFGFTLLVIHLTNVF